MIFGTYRSYKEGEYDITLRVKETVASYMLTRIYDRSRFPQIRWYMMFRNKDTIRIDKNKSTHKIEFFNNGENFVVYPYRDGIPYLFEKVVLNGNGQ